PQTTRPGDGVSTYLALTFGTLLSSQGTDASFETFSQVSPGASLRCFQHYQAFSVFLTTIRRQAESDPGKNSEGRSIVIAALAGSRLIALPGGGQGYDSTGSGR
ncbi:hypothetical protein AB0C51_22640, partial [Streptomyces pathocidini]|uniref:hypothetical protein n=1 Tax=Streptomyces pathocidini TaxID=1650571 RepID=UPI0033ED85ED